jgi:hypothetical protein
MSKRNSHLVLPLRKKRICEEKWFCVHCWQVLSVRAQCRRPVRSSFRPVLASWQPLPPDSFRYNSPLPRCHVRMQTRTRKLKHARSRGHTQHAGSHLYVASSPLAASTCAHILLRCPHRPNLSMSRRRPCFALATVTGLPAGSHSEPLLAAGSQRMRGGTRCQCWTRRSSSGLTR